MYRKKKRYPALVWLFATADLERSAEVGFIVRHGEAETRSLERAC